MPRKRAISLRCPTCRQIVLRSAPEFPFCSERCRVIDLGKWASGSYVISSPLNDPETGNSNYPDQHVKKLH
ncbi:MAG TPA: DNA gyrase inhibitor YacG [Candidatus Binatia bacterium]|nr:DNA gyrase inhibitor YacG [Candidatus Binatia bacterium]